ncbi:putative penicillin-binding protein PbpX [compost metagenome]
MDHTGEATTNTPTIKGYISTKEGWKIAGPYYSQSGSGTLYTTLDDLLKWDAALNDEKVLTQDSLDKMFTSYSYKNYGYGWMIDNEQTPAVSFHNGSGTGYSTGISRNLGGGLTIILLGNQAGRDTITFMKELRNRIE